MTPRPADLRRWFSGLALAAVAALMLGGISVAPLAAQDLESFDPDQAYDGPNSGAAGGVDADLATPAAPEASATNPGFDSEFGDLANPAAVDAQPVQTGPATTAPTAASTTTTYGEDDLIGAAEGVFGKGAEGLAKLIEDMLKKQGEPNGYIVGREAGGAFIVGARYGSGTLHHKIEGEHKVYWTGPSIGFDAGANAANTFVLVYNLYDTDDLYKRFPAGEGQAYFVGGLNASYLRRGDIVLIPIRVGAGLRLGINAGYMKFSKEQRWLPF
ncbi:MAG: DUF1134 domain-containing protein [Erythrobacter sp.]|nr:DUF1134 domain-containing protein [Erythrobacter sp.]